MFRASSIDLSFVDSPAGCGFGCPHSAGECRDPGRGFAMAIIASTTPLKRQDGWMGPYDAKRLQLIGVESRGRHSEHRLIGPARRACGDGDMPKRPPSLVATTSLS